MQKSINRQVKEQETIIVELKLQKLCAQTTPLSSNQISELEELIKSRDTIYNGKPIQSIQEGEFEGFLRTPSEIKKQTSDNIIEKVKGFSKTLSTTTVNVVRK